MPRVAVIADDLTGAADAGVHFAPAAVAFHGSPLPDADVVVADTESRGIDAADRVRTSAAALAGARVLLKKIDSTLRGDVRAEVAAALEGSGRSRAVVAPAFPAMGRVTAGGVQYADGEPVGELDGAVDARTDADLDAVVAGVDDPAEVLWVGTAGLARALAAAYPGPSAMPEPWTATDFLVVVGSTHPAALAQAQRAEAAGLCVVAEVAAVEPGTCLVLTGGHTAITVARRLGATGLELHGEIEPGVVAGRLIGPQPHPVITKAGGFGDPDTLVRAVRERMPG